MAFIVQVWIRQALYCYWYQRNFERNLANPLDLMKLKQRSHNPGAPFFTYLFTYWSVTWSSLLKLKNQLSATHTTKRVSWAEIIGGSRAEAKSLSTLLLLHVVPSTMQEIVNAQINVTGITNPYLDQTENLTYYWVCEPTTQNWEAYYLAKPSVSWNLWYQCWEALYYDSDPNLKIQNTVCTFSP